MQVSHDGASRGFLQPGDEIAMLDGKVRDILHTGK
jgi:hypothetical protein